MPCVNHMFFFCFTKKCCNFIQYNALYRFLCDDNWTTPTNAISYKNIR